jgi:phage terminase Nu1 subunit (DNA packaging protein)
MSATAGRSDHAIKGAEDSGAVLFGRPCLFIAAAIGHGLATASLFLRVYDVDSQSFEQLESGDADVWIEHVYVTGDHERDRHRHFIL